MTGLQRSGKALKRWAPGGLLWSIVLTLGLCAGCASPGAEDGRTSPEEASERLASFNYNLAEKFWERDRLDLALRCLNMAVRQDPEAPPPRLRILDLYLAGNDPESALAYLEKCPADLAEQPSFMKRRALALELCGRGEEAALLLDDAAARASKDSHLLSTAAENRLIRGEDGEAFGILEKAFERFPEEVSFLESLAALCRVRERYSEEAEFRMQLAWLRPGDGGKLRAAARAFVRAKRMEDGLARIAELAARCPAAPRGAVLACLGYLHYWKGDHESAVSCLAEALTTRGFKPDHDEVLALAEIHLRNRSYPQAIDLLERDLEKNPVHGLSRAALAFAHLCAGSPDQCRRVIDEAPEGQKEEDLFKVLREKLNEVGDE